MNRFLITVLFSFMIIVGCTKTNESFEGVKVEVNSNKNEKGNIKGENDQSIAKDVVKEMNSISEGEKLAVIDAQEFIKVIKEKNETQLLQLLDDPRLNLEGVRKIIEGFDLNFDLDTLSSQINYSGISMYPDGGQYEFDLVDKNHKENNEENSLLIHYQENGRVYHNPYIQYFPYAEKMVIRYIEIIEKGDTAELARFLNPDDLEIPVWVAEGTIKNYASFFENSELTTRYTSGFTFVIEDIKGKQHEIKVVYGDGLMSIKDNFIPDF